MTRSRRSTRGLRWREAGDEAANAMALATVSPAGAPSVRVVLLRGADHDGLVFHTHRLSRKGVEVDGRAEVALVLRWTRPIHRQGGRGARRTARG